MEFKAKYKANQGKVKGEADLYAIRRVSSSEDTELRQGLRQRFRMDDPDRGKPRNRLQERKFEGFVVKITV
jgi:hypothetical protein